MKRSFWNRDIILLLAASFFFMGSSMLVTPLITGFSESLGAPAWMMGLVGGLMNLCALAVQPFAGNLTDRMSKHRLSTIGAIFLTAASLGYVLARNPFVILICRIVNGVGFACCSVCFSTWVANLFPKDKIGFGMGIYGLMNALAMSVSPALSVAVYHRTGYRTALGLGVAFSVLCALLIQLTKNKGLPIAQPGKGKQGIHLIEKQVIPFALVILCFTIPYCATQSFLVRYTERRALPIAVSLFFTIYALVLIGLRLGFRNAFDRVPFGSFLWISSASALGSMAFLWLMRNNLMMAAAAALMAGGYGIMCTVCQSAAILSAGPEKRGLANSTYYLGINSGMALGPMIGGMLYGNAPIEQFYPILMIAVPAGLLLYYGSRRILKAVAGTIE